MHLSNELLESISQQIEEAHRLLHSLYDSGDLSVDQYDPISRALLGASELRKEIDRLRQLYQDMHNPRDGRGRTD